MVMRKLEQKYAPLQVVPVIEKIGTEQVSLSIIVHDHVQENIVYCLYFGGIEAQYKGIMVV